MTKPIIKLEHVSKEYKLYKNNLKRFANMMFGLGHPQRKKALKDISVEINKGERILVLGSIDAGCTSLLRLIAGISEPTSGKVEVNGSIMELMAHGAGFDSEFSCYDNIELKANVFGLSNETVKEHEKEIIDFTEMEKIQKIQFKRAPKGFNLKLAMALYSLIDRDIMIIDNNFTSGGIECRKICQKKLKDMLAARPDATLLIATNRVKFAETICNRCLVLHEGKLVYDGPVAEAVQEYKEKYR